MLQNQHNCFKDVTYSQGKQLGVFFSLVICNCQVDVNLGLFTVTKNMTSSSVSLLLKGAFSVALKHLCGIVLCKFKGFRLMVAVFARPVH